MKTSSVVILIFVLLGICAGLYIKQTRVHVSPISTNEQVSTSTGATQTMSGDGTGVSENLILGINADASLGNYYSAYNGLTLYTFSKDLAGYPTCYGDCAKEWPPYVVTSRADIHLPATVTGNVQTVVRADGMMQVTYNNKPLYFNMHDTKPHDTYGATSANWSVAKP